MESSMIIIGLIGTLLIHCTYIFGDNSIIMLVLANNVGRCGLFLYIMYLGYYVRNNSNNLKRIGIASGISYIIGFSLNIVAEYIRGKHMSWKYLIGTFVRGTPGNIWVIYSLIVFCVVFKLYRSISNSNTKLLLKSVMLGGYSIIALFLFCYANIYSGIISIDNGFIMKVFLKVLGTNRSPYILGLPFMYFGALYKESQNKMNNKALSILLFGLWCAEVILINKYTGNYNLYMTIIGIFATISVFGRSVTQYGKGLDERLLYLSVILFAVQYSVISIVVTTFCLDTFSQYVILFLGGSILTLIIIRMFRYLIGGSI